MPKQQSTIPTCLIESTTILLLRRLHHHIQTMATSMATIEMEIPSTHASDRTYHAFTLASNGLRCCVVSDCKADKAAAAIAVAAGQLHDPNAYPGIAHLTEHMLFMGSETYPLENEYDQYIQQHGGHSNAYTALEETVYYFDVSCAAAADSNTSNNNNINNTNKLRGALDRLACAVTEPLVRTASLERELQAVDSEHSKNMANDHWRLDQLCRTLWAQAQQQHAYGNFGTGNRASLLQAVVSSTAGGESSEESSKEEQYQQLRNQIMAFFQRYYTASNMTLCVLGKQSVAELQSLVEEIFSKIPRETAAASTSTTTTTTIPPLPTPPATRMVQWVPLRASDGAQLELQWIVTPPQYPLYESKPSRVWSHILGHEGPGTLLAEWRARQWAHDLTADDASTNTTGFSLFSVTVELTELGQEHVVEMLQMLYYYMETVMMGGGGDSDNADNTDGHIPDWIGDELKLTGDTAFRFLAKHDAAHTCSSLVVQMHQFQKTPQYYFSGAYKVYEYDRAAVQAVGQCLRRDQPVLMLLGSPEFGEGLSEEEEDGDSKNPDTTTAFQKDPWYGTRYRVVPESDATHVWRQFQEQTMDESLVANLALPAPNDMLPSDFDLVAEQPAFQESPVLHQHFATTHDAGPRCLVDTDTSRLWLKIDSNYQTPKVNLLALLRSPTIAANPESAVLAALWVEVVTELCNDFSYAASMAGLHCGFQDNVSKGGMEIQLSGYNHKAGILLERICDTIRDKLPAALSGDDSDPAFFERMRHKLEQAYHAGLVAQPYQHGSMAVDLVLESSNKGFLQQRLAYLTNKTLLTSQVLLHYSNQMLSTFQLEVLVHGNVMPKQAKEWTQVFLDRFQPAVPSRLPVARGVQLPEGKETIYRLESWNEHDENSCAVNVYQVGLVDIPTNATVSLLMQLLREPAFNILRTEEQLGYIVFTSIKTSADNVKSIMFLVQSDSFDPIHVNDRVEAFLSHFRTKILAVMPEDEFQSNVDAVCESMLERNKNLSEESSKFWSVIANQTYRFRRLQEIAEAVRMLKKTDVMRFFDRYVLAQSPHRRKLAVQIFGTAHEAKFQELQKAKQEAPPTSSDDTDNVILIENPDEFVRTQPLFAAQNAASIEDLMLDYSA